ncbi:MAG: ABC transporter permease [Thermoplasmataceae archaeon]
MAEAYVTTTKPKKVRNARLESAGTTFKLFFKNKTAFAGFVITAAYFIVALLDAVYPSYLGVSNISSTLMFLPGHTPNSQLPTPPTFGGSWYYWLGTTQSRIPLLPAMLASLKIDLGYSVLIVLVGMSSGLIIGSFSGFIGGYLDEIVMRITDIFFSLPFLVFAIVITFVLGFTITNIVIALVIIWWPTYARLARGLALQTKALKYVEAAYASGSTTLRTVFSHIVPNVLSPIYVQVSLDLGSIVQIFAALDFLGFNQGNIYLPELGNLINQGQNFLAGGIWWPVVIPGLFLLVFTVSINLMGDGLRDVLDPKLRR